MKVYLMHGSDKNPRALFEDEYAERIFLDFVKHGRIRITTDSTNRNAKATVHFLEMKGLCIVK